MNTRQEQIRALNDELGQHLLGGAVITPGIAALGQQAVERIVQIIAVYDDFCHANDPHEEHDSERSMLKERAFSSKSIILTEACSTTRSIRLIRISQSVSSPLCRQKSTSG